MSAIGPDGFEACFGAFNRGNLRYRGRKPERHQLGVTEDDRFCTFDADGDDLSDDGCEYSSQASSISAGRDLPISRPTHADVDDTSMTRGEADASGDDGASNASSIRRPSHIVFDDAVREGNATFERAHSIDHDCVSTRSDSTSSGDSSASTDSTVSSDSLDMINRTGPLRQSDSSNHSLDITNPTHAVPQSDFDLTNPIHAIPQSDFDLTNTAAPGLKDPVFMGVELPLSHLLENSLSADRRDDEVLDAPAPSLPLTDVNLEAMSASISEAEAIAEERDHLDAAHGLGSPRRDVDPPAPPAHRVTLDILQNRAFTLREKTVLVRQQLPALKEEMHHFAQDHSEMVGILFVSLGNLLTDDSIWKMQYSTMLMHEICKKLDRPKQAAGSIDDYLFHTLIQILNLGFLKGGSLSTVALTALSSPTIVNYVIQQPWYIRLKEFIVTKLNALLTGRIRPITDFVVPKAAGLSIGFMATVWALKSAAPNEAPSTTRVCAKVTARVLTERLTTANPSYLPSQALLWDLSRAITEGTLVGSLIELSDPRIDPSVKKVSAAVKGFNAMMNAELRVLTQLNLASIAAQQSVEKIVHMFSQLQQGALPRDLNIRELTSTIAQLTGTTSNMIVTTDQLERDIIGAPPPITSVDLCTTNPTITKMHRVFNGFRLGSLFGPWTFISDLSDHPSAPELMWIISGMTVSHVTGSNLLGDVFSKAMIFSTVSSKMHSEHQLAHYKCYKYPLQAKLEFLKRVSELNHSLLVRGFHPKQIQEAKQGVFQTFASLAHFALAHDSHPMLVSLTNLGIIQAMEEGVHRWGLHTASPPQDTIDALPLQLITGVMLSLFSMIMHDPKELALLNALGILLTHPYIVNRCKKEPWCKAIANFIRDTIPGLRTATNMTRHRRDLKLAIRLFRVKAPWIAGPLANLGEALMTYRAVQNEAGLPETRRLARHVKDFVFRFSAIGIAFPALDLTLGRQFAYLTGRIQTGDNPIEGVISMATLYLLANYTGVIDSSLDAWKAAFITASVGRALGSRTTQRALRNRVVRGAAMCSALARRTRTIVTLGRTHILIQSVQLYISAEENMRNMRDRTVEVAQDSVRASRDAIVQAQPYQRQAINMFGQAYVVSLVGRATFAPESITMEEVTGVATVALSMIDPQPIIQETTRLARRSVSLGNQYVHNIYNLVAQPIANYVSRIRLAALM